MKPDTFNVTRSVRIKATRDIIFPYINDFKMWKMWSPYEKLDPEMKTTITGELSGKGAKYTWEGNMKVGQGIMEIVESTPVRIFVDFKITKPMVQHNMSEFTLAEEGEFTVVSWHMYGPSSMMSKLMQVFVSMDKVTGKGLESGLANLKNVVETQVISV